MGWEPAGTKPAGTGWLSLGDAGGSGWKSLKSESFSPLSIADLELWLNGNGLSGSVGDPIAVWLDASGNGNNAVQGNASHRPTIAGDRFGTGLGARFEAPDFSSATSQFLELADFLTGFTEGEVFLVFKIDNDPPTSDTGSGLWGIGNVSGENVHVPYVDGNIYESFGSLNRKFVGNPTLSLSADYRVYNLSSKAGEWTARLNGGVLFTTASNTVGWRSPTPLLGAMSSGLWLRGHIDEMVLFSRVLTPEERGLITGYLLS